MPNTRKTTAGSTKPNPGKNPKEKAHTDSQYAGEIDLPKGVKPMKYVILANCNTWRCKLANTTLELNSVGDGAINFHEWKPLVEPLKVEVAKAVQVGLLGFTNNPDKYVIPSRKYRREHSPSDNSMDNTPRFITKEYEREEVINNKLPARAPQFTGNTMTVPDADKKIFDVLKLTWTEIVSHKLEAVVGSMKDKGEAVKFLLRAKRLESHGINHATTPRRQVLDLIDKLIEQLDGKQIRMSRVAAEVDEDADPNQRARFTL